MIHLTGWGDKRLMFRFPAYLVDMEEVEAYGDPLGRHVIWSARGDAVLLDICFRRDPGTGWIEAERWLPSLVPLRSDILLGDYRVLYLAWLKSLTPEDAEEMAEEPPIPAGLRDLSPQLSAFLELFEVDSHLLEVASQASEEIPVFTEGLSVLPRFGLTEADARRAVEALPRYEVDAFLLRIAGGEPLADVALLRRLREVAGIPATTSAAPRRTTTQLLAAAVEARRHSEGRKMEATRARYVAELEDLAAREEQAWAMVARLAAQRGARPNDEAVDLLLKLREAASYKGCLPEYETRLAGFCAHVKGRRGLMGKLRAAKLCR
jgi:hypothetical protein